MKDELAQLIALSAATFYRSEWLKHDTDEQARRCQQLNGYNVLSVSALASIFEVSRYRIEQILGPKVPAVRGALNPHHLSILAYVLSNHQVSDEMLKVLVNGGTGLATISRLTLLSRRTLSRRINDLD